MSLGTCRLLALAYAILLQNPVWAADGYVCTGSLSAGFSYNKALKRWERASFNNEENKYALARAANENKSAQETSEWVVKQIGSEHEMFRCNADFVDEDLSCHNALYDFHLNRADLRFMLVYTIGYVGFGPGAETTIGALKRREEGSDTPMMVIGGCRSR